jgi:hypothetical protein
VTHETPLRDQELQEHPTAKAAWKRLSPLHREGAEKERHQVKTHGFLINEVQLKGYRAGLDKVWDPDEKLAYDRWKGLVRMKANQAGVPEAITPDMNVFVRVFIGWARAARIDGDNVLKSLVDGLWKQDRALAGGSWERTTDNGEEWAEVEVVVKG